MFKRNSIFLILVILVLSTIIPILNINGTSPPAGVSQAPTIPAWVSQAPTSKPTTAPTTAPTSAPTTAPTVKSSTAPTAAPTTPAGVSQAPTSSPTAAPTIPAWISQAPTSSPTPAPTPAPTIPAGVSQEPTIPAGVSQAPTTKPTAAPTTTVVSEEHIDFQIQDASDPQWWWDVYLVTYSDGTKKLHLVGYRYGLPVDEYRDVPTSTAESTTPSDTAQPTNGFTAPTSSLSGTTPPSGTTTTPPSGTTTTPPSGTTPPFGTTPPLGGTTPPSGTTLPSGITTTPTPEPTVPAGVSQEPTTPPSSTSAPTPIPTYKITVKKYIRTPNDSFMLIDTDIYLVNKDDDYELKDISMSGYFLGYVKLDGNMEYNFETNSTGFKGIKLIKVNSDHTIEAFFIPEGEYFSVTLIVNEKGELNCTYNGKIIRVTDGIISFKVKKDTSLIVNVVNLTTTPYTSIQEYFLEGIVVTKGGVKDLMWRCDDPSIAEPKVVCLNNIKEDWIVEAKFKSTIRVTLANGVGIGNYTEFIPPNNMLPKDLDETIKKLEELIRETDSYLYYYWAEEICRIEQEKEWGEPVNVSSGILRNAKLDLVYNNVGINMIIDRSYIGDSKIEGSLGKKWRFNYDTRIGFGLDLSKIRDLSKNIGIYQDLLSQLNIMKGSYEDIVKDFYINWQNLSKQYPDILKSHKEIKKAYEYAKNAFGLLPQNIQDSVVMENSNNTVTNNTGDNNTIENNTIIVKLGDVNSDGKFDISDVMMISKSLIGINQSGYNEVAADINRDGKVSLIDVFTAAKVCIGLETLPKEFVTLYTQTSTEPINELWFNYILREYPLSYQTIDDLRKGYNPDDNSTTEIPTITDDNVKVNVDGKILINEAVIPLIIESYKKYKPLFEEIDKLYKEINAMVDAYNIRWKEIKKYCEDGVKKGNEIEAYENKKNVDSKEIRKLKELTNANIIRNSFANIPFDMLDIGSDKILLINENGTPLVYEIPANTSDLPVELKSKIPTKDKVYMLEQGRFMRVLADNTKCYYDQHGQLEMITGVNGNYLQFGYTYGLKNENNDENIIKNEGEVYLSNKNIIVDIGKSFETKVYVNTGDNKIGGYSIEIKYDPRIITVDKSVGEDGITAGSNGFVTAVIVNNETGKININGYDTGGKGPGKDINLFNINWKSVLTGECYIYIDVGTLIGVDKKIIGGPQGIDSRVVVKEGIYEDITGKTRLLTEIKDQFGRVTKIERDNINGLIKNIIDPKGRVVSYDYNINKMLIKQTGIKGDSVSYIYENDLLKKIIQPDNSYVEYFYRDLNGKQVVEYVQLENGKKEEFRYYPELKYSEYWNPSGVLERDYYDDKLRTVKIEFEDGSSKSFEYDDNDNLVKFIDEEDNVIEYGYDESNNMIWVSYPNEDEDKQVRSIDKWEYNKLGKVTKHTDKMGNVTTLEYDSKDNLTTVVNPDKTRQEYIRNARGQIEYLIDPKGNKTKYEYDQYGYLSRIINAIGVKKLELGDNTGAMQNSIEYRYNIIGDLELVRDSMGNEIKYEMEDKGEIFEKRVIDSYGIIRSIYNNRDDMIKEIDKNGEETNFEYDNMHNITKVIMPTGDIIEYNYREDGKLIEKIVGGISHTKYYYDNRGRLEKKEQIETQTSENIIYKRNNLIWKVIDNNKGIIKEYGNTPGGRIKWTKDSITELYEYFKYNSNGELKEYNDIRGNKIIYEYDNMNRLIKIRGIDGVESMYEYDENGNRRVIIENSNIDGFNYITEVIYDELNRQTTLIDPNGYRESKTYNNIGLVDTIIEKGGRKSKYEYDKIGRVLKEYLILKDENTGVENEYLLMSKVFNDPAGRDVTITDESGNTINYKNDAMNRLKIFTDQFGQKTYYYYDKLGNIQKITNAKGFSKIFNYDVLGRIVSTTNENGESNEYKYDDVNNIIRVIDAEGRCHESKYDKMSRIIEKNIVVKDQYGNESYFDNGYRYQYDLFGNLIAEIDEKGNSYEYKYDNMNRLVSEIHKDKGDKNNIKHYIYYPDNGLAINQFKVIDFNREETLTTHDKLGRVIKIQQSDDIKIFEYYPNGNVKKSINNNSELRFEYDVFGALKKSYDAKTDTIVENEYNRINKLTKRKLYNGSNSSNARVVEYQFDKADRLSKIIDDDGAETIYSYDEINRLMKETRPNGIDIDYKYDNAGRVLEIKNINRTTKELLSGLSYIYDRSGVVKYKLDEKGGVTGYKYDEAGRVKEVMYPFTSSKVVKDLEEMLNSGNYVVNNNQGNAIKYTYNITESNFNDVNKNDIENMLKSKEEVKRKYLGLQTTDDIKWEISRGVDSIEFGRELNVDIDAEQIIRNTLLSLTNNTVIFDNNQRVCREIYEYDQRGNRISKINGWGKTSYEYDVNDKLMKQGNREYSYDSNGNIKKEKLGNVETVYTYNSSNRVIDIYNEVKGFIGDKDNGLGGGVIYTYDVYGRRNSENRYKHEISTTYNTINYIFWSIQIPIITTNRVNDIITRKEIYDGFGIESIGELNYYKDSNKHALISENVGVSSKTSFDPSYSILRVLDKKYYHQDDHGSTIMKSDVNGNVSGKYIYDVFGVNYGQEFTQEGEVGYTGKLYTKATGLYNYGYRDYLPQMARFTTVDPVKDGNNWYTYCYNDPVNLIDPDGLDPVLDFYLGYYGNPDNYKGPWVYGPSQGGEPYTQSTFDAKNRNEFIKIFIEAPVTYEKENFKKTWKKYGDGWIRHFVFYTPCMSTIGGSRSFFEIGSEWYSFKNTKQYGGPGMKDNIDKIRNAPKIKDIKIKSAKDLIKKENLTSIGIGGAQAIFCLSDLGLLPGGGGCIQKIEMYYNTFNVERYKELINSNDPEDKKKVYYWKNGFDEARSAFGLLNQMCWTVQAGAQTIFSVTGAEPVLVVTIVTVPGTLITKIGMTGMKYSSIIYEGGGLTAVADEYIKDGLKAMNTVNRRLKNASNFLVIVQNRIIKGDDSRTIEALWNDQMHDIFSIFDILDEVFVSAAYEIGGRNGEKEVNSFLAYPFSFISTIYFFGTGFLMPDQIDEPKGAKNYKYMYWRLGIKD